MFGKSKSRYTFVEIRMPCIDIGELNGNNIFHHVVGGYQSASQQIGYHIYYLLMKFWKPEILQEVKREKMYW